MLYLILFILTHNTHSFHLPGFSPRNYKINEEIQLNFQKLSSYETQLPYSVDELPLCETNRTNLRFHENLGEILLGDVVEGSHFTVKMKQNMDCEVICVKKISSKQSQLLRSLIYDRYRVHLVLDNLPAIQKYTSSLEDDSNSINDINILYKKGYALGFTQKDSEINEQANLLKTNDKNVYINNHVDFTVKYHDINSIYSRVVGFEARGISVGDTDALKRCDLSIEELTPQSINFGSKDTEKTVYYTYSVHFEPSDVKWASRWDQYFQMGNSQIHWFSIVNSLLILFLLAVLVVLILIRTLHKDYARYNSFEDDPEARLEETGWKLVHGDVFRPPRYGSLFAVFIGTGLQIFFMTFLTLFFSLLGFLSPTKRGSLLTALIFLFLFMGLLAGYFSSITYKMFDLKNPLNIAILTAVTFPGFNFIVFFFLNIFLHYKKSSSSVSFVMLFFMIFCWFCVSLVFVFVGSHYGMKRPKIEPVTAVNLIPRQIPQYKPNYHKWAFALLSGILPFGGIFIETYYIMTSVWFDQFYYMFGVLFIVFSIFIVMCSLVSIVMCYFYLCAEDYDWWWFSFFTSGSSSIYFFLYSIFYFYSRMHVVHFVSALLYFGYMFLFSIALFVMAGTVGAISCFFFIRTIYSSIKIE